MSNTVSEGLRASLRAVLASFVKDVNLKLDAARSSDPYCRNGGPESKLRRAIAAVRFGFTPASAAAWLLDSHPTIESAIDALELVRRYLIQVREERANGVPKDVDTFPPPLSADAMVEKLQESIKVNDIAPVLGITSLETGRRAKGGR